MHLSAQLRQSLPGDLCGLLVIRLGHDIDRSQPSKTAQIVPSPLAVALVGRKRRSVGDEEYIHDEALRSRSS
jgi:hypothetical protein